MKKAYIKIDEPGFNSGLIETPEKVKEFIDEMIQATWDCGELQSYTFSTVMMTEEEFAALPEFQGF